MSSTTLTSEQLPLQRAPLRVSQPDDPLEKEAEAVADRVMRMPSPEIGLIQRCPGGCPDEEMLRRQAEDEDEEEELTQRCPGGCPDEEMLRRQLDEEDKEEVLAQRSPNSRESTAAPPEVATAIQGRRGGGNPLPFSTRRFFEPRFGADFTMVRVHHDAEAANLAASVKARAFTVGRDLFFGSGQWSPGSSAGNRLLAHELTHVVQQRAAEPPLVQRQGGGASRPIYHRCVTVLGCSAIEHCDGRPCAVSACGRGSCRHVVCRWLGLNNLVVRAWCVYNCVPSGSAIVWYSALGNLKVGPLCLDD